MYARNVCEGVHVAAYGLWGVAPPHPDAMETAPSQPQATLLGWRMQFHKARTQLNVCGHIASEVI